MRPDALHPPDAASAGNAGDHARCLQRARSDNRLEMLLKDNPLRVVLVGYRGQLGSALVQALAGRDVLLLDYPEVDITKIDIIDQVCEFGPELVINAAAWTNVDGAEENPDACYAVNVRGVHHLALACQRSGAALVQVSTNEVFAGEPGHVYREWDQVNPRSGVYAASKAAAERVVRSLLAGRFYLVRTAWLYNNGGSNFITKILAAADKHGQLRVVADEFGNPTYGVDLAQGIVQLIDTGAHGIYHLTNAGHCSRHQWAVEVLRQSGREDVTVSAIHAAEWPRRTSPPAHAVLDNAHAATLGIRLRPWQEALAAYFEREVPHPSHD